MNQSPIPTTTTVLISYSYGSLFERLTSGTHMPTKEHFIGLFLMDSLTSREKENFRKSFPFFHRCIQLTSQFLDYVSAFLIGHFFENENIYSIREESNYCADNAVLISYSY
jgi:hypothetical protein